MSLERDNIRAMTAYTPGEQPLGQAVKLNTNENPYPPASAVIQAIHKVTPESLRRYPPPRADLFRQTAAQVHGLSPSQVIATNGGDELLRMAVTAFCVPRAEGIHGGLGEATPSYSLYDVLADIQASSVSHIPLKDDWSLPADFAHWLNVYGCRLAMIVNPHAPSGRLESLEALEKIAREFRGVLLIDEAYVDFATHDAIPLLKSGLENILLLRSLSKGYSLAGMRFGYGLGSPALIAALEKVRDSYNTDALSQAGAVAALEHRTEALANCRKVIAERERLAKALADRGFHSPPSQSNFLLTTVPERGSQTARAIYEAMKIRNILVRHFAQDRLRDKLRITIGTPEQNNVLLAAIDGLILQSHTNVLTTEAPRTPR